MRPCLDVEPYLTKMRNFHFHINPLSSPEEIHEAKRLLQNCAYFLRTPYPACANTPGSGWSANAAQLRNRTECPVTGIDRWPREAREEMPRRSGTPRYVCASRRMPALPLGRPYTRRGTQTAHGTRRGARCLSFGRSCAPSLPASRSAVPRLSHRVSAPSPCERRDGLDAGAPAQFPLAGQELWQPAPSSVLPCRGALEPSATAPGSAEPHDAAL